jgi:uncharacterized protein
MKISINNSSGCSKALPDVYIVPHRHVLEQRQTQSLCCTFQLGYTATTTSPKGRLPMFRLIFWIALITIGIWLWRRINNAAPRPAQNAGDAESMVRCAHCNLHVPQREALEHSGNWYCSQPHLELGPRKLDQ